MMLVAAALVAALVAMEAFVLGVKALLRLFTAVAR